MSDPPSFRPNNILNSLPTESAVTSAIIIFVSYTAEPDIPTCRLVAPLGLDTGFTANSEQQLNLDIYDVS